MNALNSWIMPRLYFPALRRLDQSANLPAPAFVVNARRYDARHRGMCDESGTSRADPYCVAPRAPHIHLMEKRRHPALRIVLLSIGFLLLAITPIVGPIPGPGGLFTFAGGMILILQNSNWARKVFARTKRRWPRFGHYSEKAMRRQSWRRRRDRDMATSEAKAAGFGTGAR
jgi:hypothetical protein